MALTMFAILVMPAACGAAGQLTRSKAERMIKEFGRFKAPVALALKSEDDIRLFPKSPDETEQAVRARVLQNYFMSNTKVTVLRHLGYVDVNALVVHPFQVKDVRGFSVPSPWVFKIEPTLTEKGKELARSHGTAGDKAVVLARKEIAEVTGVRERAGRAAVDFTWKAIPTEAGRAFDPASNSFKGLPPELREALTTTRGIGPFGRSAVQDWDQVYKATANFQKYDEGWRLTSISSDMF